MITTRFAPSPTGYLHIGGVRTALYSWLHAKRHGGKAVLRIEDTDLERSTPEAVEAILEGLSWLGLTHDEGPYYQTKRFDRYKTMIEEMLKRGLAYHCYCSKEELETMREQALANKQKPRYNGKWRPETGKILPPVPAGIAPVVRFKNPIDGVTSFDDLIHGKISVDNRELDDLIIARADGTPTYNFCVVIDDMDMQITHVVRGDDHINNTPRQINILKALEVQVPHYAHVPMILGDDGLKLSKRHGAVSVTHYRDEGYLPEAILNYLVRLGWAHGDQEIFSLQEMIQYFDITTVNKSASAFNTSKLQWLNQHYMMQLTPEALANSVSPYLTQQGIPHQKDEHLAEVVKNHVARCHTLVELAEMIGYIYQEFDHYALEDAEKYLTVDALPVLSHLRTQLGTLTEWQSADIQACIKVSAQQLNVKMPQIGLPLRTAVVGRASSPNLDITLYLVGQSKTLQRLDKAIQWIQASNA